MLCHSCHASFTQTKDVMWKCNTFAFNQEALIWNHCCAGDDTNDIDDDLHPTVEALQHVLKILPPSLKLFRSVIITTKVDPSVPAMMEDFKALTSLVSHFVRKAPYADVQVHIVDEDCWSEKNWADGDDVFEYVNAIKACLELWGLPETKRKWRFFVCAPSDEADYPNDDIERAAAIALVENGF